MERSELTADGQSLAYGIVKIVDAAGNYVPTAPDILATARVSGTATLEAFGNGRGATKENTPPEVLHPLRADGSLFCGQAIK